MTIVSRFSSEETVDVDDSELVVVAEPPLRAEPCRDRYPLCLLVLVRRHDDDVIEWLATRCPRIVVVGGSEDIVVDDL